MDVFTGLLFADEAEYAAAAYAPPVDDAVFEDLNIDKIVAAVVPENLNEYQLNKIYRQRPRRRLDADFRAAISRDLWDDELRAEMNARLADLTRARDYMKTSDNVHITPVKEKWKLDAAIEYVNAVTALCERTGKRFNAEGLERFSSWLREYAKTDAFTRLRDEAFTVKAMVDGISYELDIDLGRNSVVMSADTGAGDVVGDLAKTFGRYDLDNVNLEIVAFADINMNMLEREILAHTQKEHPGLYDALIAFDKHFDNFIHERILAFKRETLFYVTFIEFAKRLESKGFVFALPRFSDDRAFAVTEGFDMALAIARGDADRIVLNDFVLNEGESNFLLTGPNQGGKTTFSRMLGQILFFSSLGLPAPCKDARLFWTNGVKTHFNAEENPADGSGRLKEELMRLKKILVSAPEGSVVILNELFSSATTYDALEMGRHIMRLFEKKRCVCLYVTHLFELSANSGAINLIAEITGEPEPVCTYKIIRAETVRNAHANRLLAGRRLLAADIKERTNVTFAAIPSNKNNESVRRR